jgi:hypothetical protein
LKYIITNVTSKGFEIMMDRSADSDIPFSWQAVAVKDPQTFGKDALENSASANTNTNTNTNVDANGSVSGATNSSPNPNTNAESGGFSNISTDNTDSSVGSSAVSGASDSNTEFSADQPALLPPDAVPPSSSPNPDGGTSPIIPK